MKINNVPVYAKEKKYIVYREVNDENWFYGAFNDINKAAMSAGAINGRLAENDDRIEYCEPFE